MPEKVLDAMKCPEWYFKHLRTSDEKERQLAVDLCKRVVVSDRRCLTLRDLTLFEQYLDVEILVVSSKSGNRFIRAPNEGEEREDLPSKNDYFYTSWKTETEGHTFTPSSTSVDFLRTRNSVNYV